MGLKVSRWSPLVHGVPGSMDKCLSVLFIGISGFLWSFGGRSVLGEHGTLGCVDK